MAKYIGVVLSGGAQIVRVDYSGNRSILAAAQPSDIFGQSFAFAELELMPVDVIASSDTKILLFEARRIANSCTNACEFHSRMIYNLLSIMAKKNLVFQRKSEITSKRSTREKLMTYLLIEAKNLKSNKITVPFDRQELADYLEVDRSGLSAEIGKLRREGLIDCKKNMFIIK